ncbi:MAG: TolC family protein [Candidatus Kapaibacterium sp.]|nr:TolC family protein [Ignavibacteriota bacterium]MCB9221881.1 TolC family protein [Ignavibacteria bacterium]
MKLVSVHKLVFVATILILTFQTQVIVAEQWTLHKCIDSAIVHNKSLEISRNEIEISKEKKSEVYSNLIPKIDLNSEYKYFTDLPYQIMPMSIFGGPSGKFKEVQFGVPHNINANLLLSMPLYNAQIIGGISASEKGIEMKKILYKKSEEDLVYQITNLYYNLQILENTKFYLDSNLQNSLRLLGTIELLKDNKLATGVDVTKVELQLRQIENKIEMLDNQRSQAINMLKFLIGKDDEEIEIISEIKLEEIDYENNTSPLNIEIKEKKSELIKQEITNLKNERLPSLMLIGNYGTTGYGYNESPNEFLNFYPIGFVGLKFNLPIFTGTVLPKKVEQKSLELKNNELELEIIRDKNKIDIENALRIRQTSSKQIKNSVLNIELADNIYNQTLALHSQGLANITDILLADNSLRESQQEYLTNLIEYLKSDLEYRRLIGHLATKE